MRIDELTAVADNLEKERFGSQCRRQRRENGQRGLESAVCIPVYRLEKPNTFWLYTEKNFIWIRLRSGDTGHHLSFRNTWKRISGRS